MARMSTKKRASLPSSAFAGPGRSFPVNDVNHAEAAIMLSKYAADPGAVKARARAALRRFRGRGGEERGETTRDSERRGG